MKIRVTIKHKENSYPKQKFEDKDIIAQCIVELDPKNYRNNTWMIKSFYDAVDKFKEEIIEVVYEEIEEENK